MEITELYKKVYVSCVHFAVYQKKEIIHNVENFMPLLNNFVKFFFKKNVYGLDEEDYQLLQQLLLQILQDMMQALENRDIVLLEDTVEYGLKTFLELFFSDEQELQELREVAINECENL